MGTMKTLILIGFISFVASVSFSDSDQIQVSDLPTVIGRLGKPLGDRIVIAGVPSSKAILVANPFDVSEIDGKAAAKLITIELRGRVTLQSGTHYKFEGYESGGFEGDPTWLNSKVQQPFGFRSFFIITKVVEPKPQ